MFRTPAQYHGTGSVADEENGLYDMSVVVKRYNYLSGTNSFIEMFFGYMRLTLRVTMTMPMSS